MLLFISIVFLSLLNSLYNLKLTTCKIYHKKVTSKFKKCEWFYSFNLCHQEGKPIC